MAWASLCTPCRPAATLRIWSKAECKLAHVGNDAADEAVGLQPAVAWQPNGRHIFCSQVVGTARSVSLFERNGLGHGAFVASRNEALRVDGLWWNCTSDTLAVLLAPLVRNRRLTVSCVAHAASIERQCAERSQLPLEALSKVRRAWRSGHHA